MPYTPSYQEIFESIAPDNVLAIVKRDFKSCLDVFYASDSLPDFAQRTFGDFMRIDMPSLSVQTDGGSSSDEGQFESGQVKLVLEMAVEDADPVVAARNCIKYARALRAVLKTASIPDYVSGSTLTIFSLARELSWRYGQAAKNADAGTWLKPVQFEFTLKYNER